MKSGGGLDAIQQAAQDQFARQSHRYGSGHILARVEDVRQAVEPLRLPSGATVLDIATGAGHTGLYLAESGCRVTLSDLADAMLDRAREEAARRGLQVEFRRHSAESLPYAGGTFDLVICRVAAHHFSAPERFICETARVLKPGGAFVLIDGSVEDGQAEAEGWLHQVEKLRDPSHHRFLTPSAWTALCEGVGLRVIRANLEPFKQPDLEWYFETADTPPANRERVRELVREAPAAARGLFRVAEEEGRTVWWWQRLTLVARRGSPLV
jgi:ubiquinone/menaquinone biosynthesis C-methylase UbiE